MNTAVSENQQHGIVVLVMLSQVHYKIGPSGQKIIYNKIDIMMFKIVGNDESKNKSVGIRVFLGMLSSEIEKLQD